MVVALLETTGTTKVLAADLVMTLIMTGTFSL
jgi:hypothetical protein